MSCTITRLPEDLFKIIQTFLSCDDYHYFLNSSKTYFQVLKRKTIYFTLTAEWSRKYLLDLDFRSLLLSKVENGWNQIRFLQSVFNKRKTIPRDLPIHTISSKSLTNPPVENWNQYKSIICTPPDCKKSRARRTIQLDIPPIPNVKELILHVPSPILIDLNVFAHLSKLNICCGIKGKDISPLRNIHDLSLPSLPEVTDFSMLGSQRTLKLSRCIGLTDVTSLRSVRKLTLSACPNIRDVSPLNGVYDLSLISWKIKDISGLGNHHRLKLDGFHDVSGYDCLLHIPHVELSGCDIKDSSVLRYAKSVSIFDCYITDVSPLRNVEKLEIFTVSPRLSGLHELSEVQDLSLTMFEMILKASFDDEFISSLKCKRLKLKNLCLRYPTSLSVFPKTIEHLTIGWEAPCVSFINQGYGSYLNYLSCLRLEQIKDLTSLEGLGDIPKIELFSCFGLKHLQGLGRNRSVEVSDCSNLEDVSSLATVPIVLIKNCPKLSQKSFECLNGVPRLKIVTDLTSNTYIEGF